MKPISSAPMLAVFFLLLWGHSLAATAVGTNTTDQLALLSFKSSISGDPLRALASWNDSLSVCRWRGVTCSARRHPDRVTGLDLDSLDLTGSISPSLANLTFLRRIHLPGNRFHGGIPQELGRIHRLQQLNLSSNSLEGVVPSTLFHSPSLRNLSLRSNRLQGEIPPPSGNRSTLTNLDLSNNMFTGSIPPSLGNASTLSYLDLSNNSLTGGIPVSIGKLNSLAYFDMARNNLTGEIPSSLWNLSFLTVINVHTNNLSGMIPPNLGNSLPRLQKLLMYENQFSGIIPGSITNASGLQSIQLYYNQFSGTIPSNLGALQGLERLLLGNNQLEAKEAHDWSFFTGLTNCTNLQVFDVSNNRLRGVLPDSIANMSAALTWFGMMGNRISGSIPPGIANLVRLTEFRIKDNLLTGNIPATIGRLQMLHELTLAFNMFGGEIPPTIGNLTQLNLLYLEGNNLSGNVPTSLGNCQNLILLNLAYNKLTGVIPAEVVSIPSISIYLSFSDNLLTGSLPAEVGSLESLDALDVSGNRLSGEIPSTLGKCQSLEYLFMGGNLFQGTIPSSLSVLNGLIVLDLSSNNLSGEVPKFLEDFPYLDYLNLSFNNFVGEVPKNGAFANASEISVLGNYELCGGIQSLHLPSCSIQSTNKKHSSSSLKVIISVAGVVGCLILLFCLLATCYCIRKTKRKSSITKDHMRDSHTKVSYSELVKATDGFSTTNLIGVGGFGSVYKGILDAGDTNVIAVKVLNLQKQGASKSFMAECEALRNIRHRNLVKIITVCSGVDFGGNDFKALVFEFMPNGSLEKWLHPELQEQCEPSSLSLIQRLNIAIDVASALDYLHHHGQMPIVHCDLKPSNVLLDNDMIAHVSDFGLARFLDTTVSKSSHKAASSSGLKGTIGYAAPEYGTANKVSTHGDVYSYGVLLLEIFTGKRPNDDAFKEGISLHKYVEIAMPERMMDIVDKQMFLTKEDEQAKDSEKGTSGEPERTHDCLASVLKIGLLCTQELPRERMQMGDVARELMATKEAFVRGVIHEHNRT